MKKKMAYLTLHLNIFLKVELGIAKFRGSTVQNAI